MLPLLAWFLFGTIQSRLEGLLLSHSEGVGKERKMLTGVVVGFVGALLYGLLLAFTFTQGYETITGYLFLGMFLAALSIPAYRAEYILGFILGMTFTFGAVLPTVVGSLVAASSAALHFLIRLIIRVGKIRISPKLLSIVGLLASVACFWVAMRLHPGGYDWNQDYISTLLRDPAISARIPAVVAMLLLCVSIALVFERLAQAAEFTKHAKVIRIAGIGSMVYASLAFTVMHNLMVTISLIEFLIAALALLQALYVSREIGFFITGCVCFVLLVATATIYYTGYYVAVLPWAQRITFVIFAIWLVFLDYGFPRRRLPESAMGNHRHLMLPLEWQ